MLAQALKSCFIVLVGGVEMLEVYDRLIADCETLNQLSQRHIWLELTMTPSEVDELYRQLVLEEFYWQGQPSNHHLGRDTIRAAVQDWLVRMRGFLDTCGKPRPEPFLREELLRSITRYSDQQGRDGKWLVITLCGAVFRPMMAAATYLQLFDATTTDVVLVRDYHRKGFRRGVTGLSESSEATFELLPKLLHASEYAGVSVVGTSGGAVAALQYAIATGANAVVAAGPSPPFDPERRLPDGRLPGEVLQTLAAQRTPPPIALLYGRESMDRAAAEAIAELVPVTLFEIADPDETVGHNAFLPLLRRGELGGFLSERLGLPERASASAPIVADEEGRDHQELSHVP